MLQLSFVREIFRHHKCTVTWVPDLGCLCLCPSQHGHPKGIITVPLQKEPGSPKWEALSGTFEQRCLLPSRSVEPQRLLPGKMWQNQRISLAITLTVAEQFLSWKPGFWEPELYVCEVLEGWCGAPLQTPALRPGPLLLPGVSLWGTPGWGEWLFPFHSLLCFLSLLWRCEVSGVLIIQMCHLQKGLFRMLKEGHGRKRHWFAEKIPTCPPSKRNALVQVVSSGKLTVLSANTT